jgi:hypothetical protein
MRRTCILITITAIAILSQNSTARAGACPATDYWTDSHGCQQRTLGGLIASCDDKRNECTISQPGPGAGKASMKITSPKPSQATAVDKLYEVDIVCHPGSTSLPTTPTSSLVDTNTTLTTHMIGIINTSLAAPAMPTAAPICPAFIADLLHNRN